MNADFVRHYAAASMKAAERVKVQSLDLHSLMTETAVCRIFALFMYFIIITDKTKVHQITTSKERYQDRKQYTKV